MRMHRKGSLADFRLHHCGYLGAIDSCLESLKSWNEESIWINGAFDVLFSLSSKKQPESGQHFSKSLKAQRFHRAQVCSWKTETGTDGKLIEWVLHVRGLSRFYFYLPGGWTGPVYLILNPVRRDCSFRLVSTSMVFFETRIWSASPGC